ncbi:MAG: polymer-forming cytoskeletal protein, partial [Nanoarchaeota archaeon]
MLRPSSASQVPLSVDGASGQTADIFRVRNSAGTVVFAVEPDGDVRFTGDAISVIDQEVTGNITATGNLTVAGSSTLNGAVTLGDGAGDQITVNGATRFVADVTVGHNINVNNTLTFNGFAYGNVLFFNEQTNAPSQEANR